MPSAQQLTYARCRYSDNDDRTIAITIKQAQKVLSAKGGYREKSAPIAYLSQSGSYISCWQSNGEKLGDIAYSGNQVQWFICG